MKALIAGSGGQLGRSLQATAPATVEVIAPPEAEFNILDAQQIDHWLRETRADVLFNAAAYTAVDKAEGDAEVAEAVNGTATGLLAAAAHKAGARFVHVSTDFVFDGLSALPYQPETPPSPVSVYGATKLSGEVQAQAQHPDALIVRTAWVYAAAGNNFVKTMLRLMAERDEVRVVADQIGTPTHAEGLAKALWTLNAAKAHGIYHWTDAGVASWYDFAVAIQEEGLALGLLDRRVPVIPISSSAYPTPAKRPHMSVLDKSRTWDITGVAPHWRDELRAVMGKMKEGL